MMKFLKRLTTVLLLLISANVYAQNAIDLGLPSGTLWADRNLRANSPYDYNNYYDFKDAQAIINTMNSAWQIPSKAAFEELRTYCNWRWTGSGYQVTGPNGNSIFLPAGGRPDKQEIVCASIYGYYWTSTYENMPGAYHTLSFDKERRVLNMHTPGFELSVRLVILSR